MRLPPLALPLALLTLGACSQPKAAGAPEGPKLVVPIACKIGVTCEVQTYVDHDPTHGVKDYRCGGRTNDGHNGTDFRLPDLAAQARGVAVLAAADGKVARLRDGVADISIKDPNAPVVAGQECGNGIVLDHGDGWETQYCHLARGSVAVKVGETVRAGQPIARVGLSGNTEYPHVHLSLRHDAVMVDPFAPDPYGEACEAQPGLWAPAASAELAYKAGAVLNAGFVGAPVDMAAVEAGGLAPPTPGSPMLVAYVRAIDLDAGDVQELTMKGPDGAVLATSRLPPLDRAKAQFVMFVGKKAPAAGWAAGTYSAKYSVSQHGKIAISKIWAFSL